MSRWRWWGPDPRRRRRAVRAVERPRTCRPPAAPSPCPRRRSRPPRARRTRPGPGSGPARRDVLGGRDALDAAEVVDVRMREDHPHHGTVAAVRAVQGQTRGRGLLGDQRIDHDHPGVALHQRHVRQVQAPDLIDPVGDLVQALHRAEPGLTPQTRMNVSGQSSRKANEPLSQTTAPSAFFTTPGSSAATKPRCASAKSWSSSNGITFSDSACRPARSPWPVPDRS